jgi:uncharacterized protein YbbC (DUF1343 family)
MRIFLVLLWLVLSLPVQAQPLPAAEQSALYLPLLRGKRVGLVVNATSRTQHAHLVDSLRAQKIEVVRIFAPEHGFRGQADAGATVKDGIDTATGLAVVSLYGANKQPQAKDLNDLDLLVFDIQDVGVRFYTYLSTLHYVMEAAATHHKPLLVFDRPNPNGDYIDGPTLEPAFASFVGMHPIPLVHGLTLGELARMIVGEKWLKASPPLQFQVVPVRNYTHATAYVLPVRPSPNLPNPLSIRLYPSLGLFEGTAISVARGTPFPFQAIGYPDWRYGNFKFTPESVTGATQPPYQGQLCYGLDLRKEPMDSRFSLRYLLDMYARTPDKSKFFNPFFAKLAGTDRLRKAIEQGFTEDEIRRSWQTDLQRYRVLRKKYLLYPEE